MTVPELKPWQRKSMRYLMFAALCVTWTGFSFNSDPSIAKFLVASVTTIFLVLFVYSFDDIMDTQQSKPILKNSGLRFLILGSLAVVLASFLVLGSVSFYSGILILLIGTLYSFRTKKVRFNIRLKSYFILKNIFIGLGWGLLVFIGSNSLSNIAILITFIFFSLQVAIGSVIRDLDDIEEDRKDKVPTFPIVLGIQNTTFALHAVNILSASILFLGLEIDPEQSVLWILWLIVVVYRFGLLEAIRKQSDKSFLLQQVNILACSLVFVGRLAHIWIS